MERNMNTKRAIDHDRDQDRDQIPAELLEIDALLGQVARADVAAGPSRADLSQRIFNATRGAIAAHTPLPIKIESARRVGGPVPMRGGAPMRIAAGLALAATLGVVWLAGRGPGPVRLSGSGELAASSSAAADREITEWLAISDTNFVGDLQTQLTSLDAEASGLVKNFESGGSDESWYDESASGAAGGAM